MTAKCKCPECGEVIPCERTHNGIAYVWHAVHCGWGHEVEPISMSNLPEGAPPALSYQPQHLWTDGEFDMWTNIGEPTISKRCTRARLELFQSVHPNAKVRVLKIVSSAEVIDAATLETPYNHQPLPSGDRLHA